MLSCEMGGGIFLSLHLYVMGAIHFCHFTFSFLPHKDNKFLQTSHSCSVQNCGHYVFFKLAAIRLNHNSYFCSTDAWWLAVPSEEAAFVPLIAPVWATYP